MGLQELEKTPRCNFSSFTYAISVIDLLNRQGIGNEQVVHWMNNWMNDKLSDEQPIVHSMSNFFIQRTTIVLWMNKLFICSSPEHWVFIMVFCMVLSGWMLGHWRQAHWAPDFPQGILIWPISWQWTLFNARFSQLYVTKWLPIIALQHRIGQVAAVDNIQMKKDKILKRLKKVNLC